MHLPFIGEIVIYPFNQAEVPQGWAPCDGRMMRVMENQQLFSLIGTKFGGDGQTSFALPNYASAAPEGSLYCMAIQGNYPGQT